MKYHDLRDVPTYPHNYFTLESVDVAVKHPQRLVPVKLHCKVLGKGPPLLLIHGLMTSSYSFRYIIPALAEKYQVIAPDLPGAGRSEAPLDLSMSPQSIAMLICALIEALQIKPPYVVGNSLGGYQALWLAVLFPNQVRKLIVMHAPGFPNFRNSIIRLLFTTPGTHTLMRWVICRDPETFVAQNIHYHDSTLMSREEAREYASIFHNRFRTDVFFKIFRESLDPNMFRDLVNRLSVMRDNQQTMIPTRLFWARQDAIVPPEFGPRFQRLIPSAELVWFDHATHFMHVDDPARTVQEIRKFDND